MATGNFRFREYIGIVLSVLNKGADQLCSLTAKLILSFGFAYAKCWFSHDVVHFTLL